MRETRPLFSPSMDDQTAKWARRLFIPLTTLAWVTLAGVLLWGASHITRALLLLIIAAIFAFALAPIVGLLERIKIPRTLAILIVYLLLLSAICVFCYFSIRATIEQTMTLAIQAGKMLTPGPNGSPTPLEQTLISYGIAPAQIAAARQEIVTQGENFVKNSLPLLRGIGDFALDTIIMAVMSIYLLIDGSRVARWARQNAPVAARASFLLDTLQRIVGGYIRGQLILALLISLLVWIGMEFIFHLPYAVFLGAVAFAMAFIPVLGTLISGTICVLIGFSHGPLIAVGVLLYFVIIHVIESELVGPRIVGQAIGLHPVVSLFALVAGGELFGIWGALFASPLAGLLQAIIIAFWTEWRQRHPEQFQPQE
ncbi:MAG TPA: AI-2E family transporter, partial [Ktedonobacteraceae bacterium]|nr:AI-2E family transporter [Ktedonobacteraceae bacterium]